MKRNISKRFELNRKEADLLRIKSRQTGLSEGEYLRELICNSQPVEAPPRQFYETMGKANRLVSDIWKVKKKALNSNGVRSLLFYSFIKSDALYLRRGHRVSESEMSQFHILGDGHS